MANIHEEADRIVADAFMGATGQKLIADLERISFSSDAALDPGQPVREEDRAAFDRVAAYYLSDVRVLLAELEEQKKCGCVFCRIESAQDINTVYQIGRLLMQLRKRVDRVAPDGR